MIQICNVAFYKFIEIGDPQALRELIRAEAAKNGLRGTVLLATEGINSSLAGPRDLMEKFLNWLVSQPGFDDLYFKKTYSESIPFKKLLVKVKKEIITFKQPFVGSTRAPY